MRIRLRLNIKLGIAWFFAMLTALSLLVPDWVELVFGAEPDNGSGMGEWGVTAAFGIAVLVASVLSGRDLRHMRIAILQSETRHVR